MFIEGKRHPNDFFSPSETKHQDLTLAMALDLLNVLPSDLYHSLSPFREGMIAALNGGGSFSQRCLREDSLQVSLQSFLELLCLLLASQFREKNSVSLKKPRMTLHASLLQMLRGMLGFQSWDFTSKTLSGVTLPWSALH